METPMKNNDGVKTQCIKVAELRKKYGKEENLETWIKRDGNLYVGRDTRIFIHEGGTKRRFVPEKSKWHNPYSIPKGYEIIDNSLGRYRNRILMTDLKNNLGELAGMTLGCWCDQNGPCHAKVLKELYDAWRQNSLPEPDPTYGGPDDPWEPKRIAGVSENLSKKKDSPMVLCQAQTTRKKRCKLRAKTGGLCKRHHDAGAKCFYQ